MSFKEMNSEAAALKLMEIKQVMNQPDFFLSAQTNFRVK